MSFTPGPWGINPESDGTEVVAYSAAPWRIRSVIFRNFERSDRNWIANTQLAAAAPDLYAALQDAAKRLQGAGMLSLDDLVLTALAKAVKP